MSWKQILLLFVLGEDDIDQVDKNNGQIYEFNFDIGPKVFVNSSNVVPVAIFLGIVSRPAGGGGG